MHAINQPELARNIERVSYIIFDRTGAVVDIFFALGFLICKVVIYVNTCQER